MFVEVKMVDRLVTHYGWLLSDLKEVKKLVNDWGFEVKDELKCVSEVRAVLARLVRQGKEVL